MSVDLTVPGPAAPSGSGSHDSRRSVRAIPARGRAAAPAEAESVEESLSIAGAPLSGAEV